MSNPENNDLAEFLSTAPRSTINVAPGVFLDLCDALEASSKPSPALILALEKVRSGASLKKMDT